jgi:hypothetical protein
MGDVFHIEIHVGNSPARRRSRGDWIKLAVAFIGGAAVVLAKVLPGMLSHEPPAPSGLTAPKEAEAAQCSGSPYHQLGGSPRALTNSSTAEVR